MNNLKNTLPVAAGLLILILMMALINSGKVRSDDLKNVNVVNTTANPIPTAAQGTTTIAGSLSISNTPNVNVANPTDLLFQTAAGGVRIIEPQDLATIDVSRFREIRVLLVNHPSTGGSDATARVQLQILEGGIVVGNLDTLDATVDFSTAQEKTSVTKAYTIPARNLRIKAEPLLDPMGVRGHATIDVLVYGH